MALRGEASLRKIRGKTRVRGALGIDRRLTLSNRDLTLVAEVQHDGLGSAGAAETSSVLQSEAFTRGELQVLGRDEAAAQAQYQLHPLWSLSLLWLWNLNDRSSCWLPASPTRQATKSPSPAASSRDSAMSPQAPRDRPPPSTAASAPPPTSR